MPRIRLVFYTAILTICGSLWVLPTHAGTTVLDVLFVELQQAKNDTEAHTIENKIWRQWMQSGDAKVDELMREAMRKRDGFDYKGALETLNKIIAIKPDYSEVWNQRATVYFHQKEYEKSLQDIAKTLELEPRHFGSLAGRAVIRMRQTKPALARQNILEAMKVNPYLRERVFFPDLQKNPNKYQ